MVRASIPLTLWLIAPAAALAAADTIAPPRLVAGPEGIELVAPPSLLAAPRVRAHLETGLTATLAWRAGGGSGARGGARVEIRFEPWEEVFQVAALGVDGRVARATLASFDALESWWRGLRPVVLRAGAADLGTVRLELDVVPFSEAEERDAERWLAEVLERAGDGAEETVGGAAPPGADALDQVLNTLLATSIRRRAAVSFRWRVPVETTSQEPRQ